MVPDPASNRRCGGGISRRSRAASAAGLALAIAGCGGGEREIAPPPRLPSVLAEDLAARSDHVAELLAVGDRCGARTTADDLSATVVEAINAGGVPPPFQEELGGAAAALAARITCVPATPPAEPPSDDEQPAKNSRPEGRGPTPLRQGGTPSRDAQDFADWLRENAAR